MASFEILPAQLDLKFIRGDQFVMALDFDQDLTGYSFVARIFKTVIKGGLSYIAEPANSQLAFGISNTDLAAGKISLYLTESQTGGIASDDGSVRRWAIRWADPTGNHRTLIAGGITATDP